jgi:C4-dicarboxylate transporter DctM subunit
VSGFDGANSRGIMKRVAERLDKFIYKFNESIGNLFSLALILLAIFVCLNVVSRFASVSLPWLFSGSVLILIAFTFLTAAYALGEGKHVSIDTVTLLLPENSRVSLEILGYVFSLVFTILLGLESTKWLITTYTRNITTGADTLSTLPIPFWTIILVIPLGAFFLLMQLLRLIIKRTYFLVKRHASLKSSLLPVVFVITLFAVGILVAVYINPIGGLFWSLLVLFFGGTPVAFSLAVIGTAGIYLFAGGGAGIKQIPIVAFSVVESFPLAALPLFVLIGSVLGEGGLAKALFSFTELWFGRVRGSLLVVTIATGAVICAITGSSVAATALLCLISLPTLLERGFDKRLSCGTVGGASVGSLIPPSTALIVYGAVVEQSVGKLFMAALIPSLITFATYCIYVFILSFTSKAKFGTGVVAVSWTEKLASLKTAGPILLLPVLILGGIYAGVYTATEAAGVSVVYGLTVSLFVLTAFKWTHIRKACLEGGNVSSMTLFILVGGIIFSIAISQLKVAPMVVSFAKAIGASQLVVVIILFIALLIGGMFMSSMALMLITLPVFYPLAIAVGIDPLWLGVFYTFCIEIGLLTPPVGVNLFVIQGASDIPFVDIVAGNIPFLTLLTLNMVLIYLFPQLCTWLPSTM